MWIKEGMDYSKERSVPYLRGAAKSLHDENVRLRAAQSELNARLAALEAKAQQEHLARLAAEEEAGTLEAKAQREHLARLAAEEEAERRNSALEAEREEKARMQDELTRLRHEIAALQEVLERRNQALYGRSTERRPRNDDKSSGTGKGKEKRKGHGPTEQPELPRVEVVHTLTAEKLVCDACGGQMSAVDTLAEKTELIAIEKRKVVLEQHLRTVYACSCKKCIKTAAGPLKLIPGGRYALSFTVHVAYQKYFAHLPLERQVQAFAHDGGRFTTAALWDQLDALATTLKATYDKIWQAIQAESVLHADETPWAVLSNGHTQNERFYAWVCVGATYVAFRLLDTRSAEGAAIVLGSFAGTLMVDGLTSYLAAAKGKPGEAAKFKVANCHAHARRYFVEIEKHWQAESSQAVGLYRQIYEIEREGKGLPAADLLALRQAKSKPLVDELFTWARTQQQRPDVLPSTGLAKAVAYLLNHEVGLRIFLDNPAVPLDNNISERAIRPIVLGRVNYQGSRSRRGTEVHAIISTLVESAKRCGVPPEAYLFAAAEHAMEKAGNVLLPDEFKLQLDALRAMPPPPTG